MIQEAPFVMFTLCTVEYDGRAYSTLAAGRYLVVYKPDGSVMIHGADSLVPRNYMGSNCKLMIEDNRLIFIRKTEKIIITIAEILSIEYLTDWSTAKTQICRTENELVQKLFDNWHDYFDDDFWLIEQQFPTELGPIDLLGRTETTDFVVEIKRKTATIKDVSQLKRYVEALEHTTRVVKGYLAAPAISQKAAKYLTKHGLLYLEIGFD